MAGLCIYCGEQPPKKDRKGCKECLRLNRIERQEQRAALNAEGLCAYCGNAPKVEGRKGCKGCLKVTAIKTASWNKATAEQRREQRRQRRIERLEQLRTRALARLAEIEAELYALRHPADVEQRAAA
jgi:hypothetical protein